MNISNLIKLQIKNFQKLQELHGIKNRIPLWKKPQVMAVDAILSTTHQDKILATYQDSIALQQGQNLWTHNSWPQEHKDT